MQFLEKSFDFWVYSQLWLDITCQITIFVLNLQENPVLN
jgi:hypothetical protein